jgi:hypothetical protein
VEIRRAAARRVQSFNATDIRDGRADDAAGTASALPPEALPPRLAADEQTPSIDPDLLDAIDAKIEELTERMGQLERRKAAEDALLALENEIERMYPASNDDDDDDDDMTAKPRRH